MTASLLERTILPPQGEGPGLARLVEALESEHPVLMGADGVPIELPSEVRDVLHDVVVAMARGKAITVAPHSTVLTTQQAADMLGVSRPTLVRLLEEKEIPFDQPGRHRRVLLTDLLAYQERIRSERRGILKDMSRDAAAEDGYERVHGFIGTR